VGPAVASCDDIFVKVVLNWEPSEFTTVMITTDILAAINPYSMAVAPDSSRRNRLRMQNGCPTRSVPRDVHTADRSIRGDLTIRGYWKLSRPFCG
jgi:hypothetical protein